MSAVVRIREVPPAERDPLCGRCLDGRYRVEALLASGGMGRVYRAIQLPLDRPVALKVLHPTFDAESRDVNFRERFLLEAATAARLRHPHTVTIHDYGQAEGHYYIAMELLEGCSVADALTIGGPMQPLRVATILRQVCRALAEAHSVGLVHRDLKPANLFLVDQRDRSDYAKVVDFGLARTAGPQRAEITQVGCFLGSPGYSSPEQIGASDLDGRSDIYSLGVTMFEMLTGARPFSAASSALLMLAHLEEPAPLAHERHPDLGIPVALARIAHKCMEKPPGRRFQTIEALLEALEAAASALGDAGRTDREIDLDLDRTRPDRCPSVPPAAVSDDKVVTSSGIVVVDGSATTVAAAAPSFVSGPAPAPVPASRPWRRQALVVGGALAVVFGAALVLWLASADQQTQAPLSPVSIASPLAPAPAESATPPSPEPPAPAPTIATTPDEARDPARSGGPIGTRRRTPRRPPLPFKTRR